MERNSNLNRVKNNEEENDRINLTFQYPSSNDLWIEIDSSFSWVVLVE
jgi:hypothetical protein